MPAPGASGPIPTAEPPAWARVRLIEGQSAATMWQVDSATPAAQLAVGSQDGCPWRVTAPRVAPLHFELCWDGSRLWIGDTQQAGGVTVDGEPLAGWLPVAGRARIEFGTAVMLAESSQPAVSVAVPASDGGGDADEDDPTRIHLGGSAPAAVRRPETAEEPTVPVAALRPPKPEPSQPAGVRARLPMPSDPVQTVIAQIYDRPPAGYVPSAPTAWKSDSPPPAQPGTPPPADRRLSPPPGAPGIAHATGTPPSGSKTGARALDRLRSVPPRTWALGGITVAALAAVLMMGGGEPEPARPGGGPAVAAAGTEVAAAEPGDTGQRAAGDEPTAKPLEAGGPGAGGEAGAAANAGSETGATAGSEAAGSGSEAASAGSETGATASAGSETGATANAGSEAGATASAGSETGATANAGSEAGATAAAGDGDAAERAAAAPGERASDGAAASPDASALATEKRAAELLAAGRQREALAVYDELARRFPERPAFGAIVTILERQLSERCGPGGEPCSE